MTSWEILDEPDVLDICHKAAHKVAEHYKGVIEWDDLVQEAYIVIATKAVYRRFLDDRAMGGFYIALWADLMDAAEHEFIGYHKHVDSIEELRPA